MRWRAHSPTVSPYRPIISGGASHINHARGSAIHALCASDSVVIIGIEMPKEKRIELKTRILFPIINPSSHSALFPVQYAPISTVTNGARDNGALSILLLRDSVVSYRFTHSIIEYMPNRL